MYMRMDYIRAKTACRALHSSKKGQVEIKLMSRRPHHHTSLPRHVNRPPGGYAGDICAYMVGAKEYGVAPALEMRNLLQYTDVRAVVREKRSWCYREYAIRQIGES